MGFLDKLFGGSGDVSGGGDDDFGSEFDDVEVDEPDFEDDIEVEEEDVQIGPWDTAYQFAGDMLEEDGFADMQEFTRKCMMHKIKSSPMYRDRFQSGVNTINMVTDSMQNIKELKEDSEPDDMAKKAERLRNANELADQMDKMQGKEEEYADAALAIGTKLIQNISGGGGGSPRRGNAVRSDIEVTEDEI